MNLIIQDIQLYLDSNIYDLCKSVIEERQMSMRDHGSFFEMALTPENVKEEVFYFLKNLSDDLFRISVWIKHGMMEVLINTLRGIKPS